jgi:hypothetical protein
MQYSDHSDDHCFFFLTSGHRKYCEIQFLNYDPENTDRILTRGVRWHITYIRDKEPTNQQVAIVFVVFIELIVVWMTGSSNQQPHS